EKPVQLAPRLGVKELAGDRPEPSGGYKGRYPSLGLAEETRDDVIERVVVDTRLPQVTRDLTSALGRAKHVGRCNHSLLLVEDLSKFVLDAKEVLIERFADERGFHG